jgi:hypothetical protein
MALKKLFIYDTKQLQQAALFRLISMPYASAVLLAALKFILELQCTFQCICGVTYL